MKGLFRIHSVMKIAYSHFQEILKIMWLISLVEREIGILTHQSYKDNLQAEKQHSILKI